MAGAFGVGFFFALGYFVTGLWWIGNALLVEGNDFAWVWPISVIGLPTLLGLFTGTYLAIARKTADPKTASGFLAFAFFLTFSEWARGHAFTGFPWNLYGYVWADYLPMAQATHFIGAYGLTFVSILWASLGGYLYLSNHTRRDKVIAALVAAVSIGLVYAGGSYRLNNTPATFDKNVALVVVQPNILQDMKWDPVAIQDNFRKIISLSKDAALGIPPPREVMIVWPETAISPSVYTIDENMDSIRNMLAGYQSSNAYLVTGILRKFQTENGETAFGNSVVVLNERLSALDVYDKTHLVPFGEFIPFQNLIPLKPVAAFKGFKRGSGAKTIKHAGLPAFSPLVCYEVIFPDDVTSKKQAKPELLVNVTNDGWYGKSAGPYQHFAQTRLRAIEEGIPLVRSANTGISGIIDPLGRILEKADIFQEASLISPLPQPIKTNAAYIRTLLQYFLPVIALILMVGLILRKKL